MDAHPVSRLKRIPLEQQATGKQQGSHISAGQELLSVAGSSHSAQPQLPPQAPQSARHATVGMLLRKCIRRALQCCERCCELLQGHANLKSPRAAVHCPVHMACMVRLQSSKPSLQTMPYANNVQDALCLLCCCSESNCKFLQIEPSAT